MTVEKGMYAQRRDERNNLTCKESLIFPKKGHKFNLILCQFT